MKHLRRKKIIDKHVRGAKDCKSVLKQFHVLEVWGLYCWKTWSRNSAHDCLSLQTSQVADYMHVCQKSACDQFIHDSEIPSRRSWETALTWMGWKWVDGDLDLPKVSWFFVTKISASSRKFPSRCCWDILFTRQRMDGRENASGHGWHRRRGKNRHTASC